MENTYQGWKTNHRAKENRSIQNSYTRSTRTERTEASGVAEEAVLKANPATEKPKTPADARRYAAGRPRDTWKKWNRKGEKQPRQSLGTRNSQPRPPGRRQSGQIYKPRLAPPHEMRDARAEKTEQPPWSTTVYKQ
ncbi:hypothetical protein ISN44_As12g018070 [Arabidopsis suecica]|uniref:Uncharacterized protein n=1 Tax=Arabidopsis suecica TaxID=45249 RepID=A0A8T1YKC0_ARASU|nr:hypothetical protein ISN44_As12g018070 [Arabidopsis suecica]